MKPFKAHISYFFLLVSLLLISGNAFAVSSASHTSLVSKETRFSADSFSKQLYFHEVSVIEVSYQQTDEPVNPFILFYQPLELTEATNYKTSNTLNYFPQRNLKKRIQEQLYPFHFFW